MYKKLNKYRLRGLMLFCAICACQRGDKDTRLGSSSNSPPSLPKIVPSGLVCESAPFISSVNVPEASGATSFGDGRIIVIGDSGRKGAYELLDESGKTLEKGFLPIDTESSDDLEGISIQGDVFVAIASGGRIQHFRQSSTGFERVDGPYAVANNDSEFVCKKKRHFNCGKNYEGICLKKDIPSEGDCAGYIVSKKEGTLYCLVRQENGRFALDDSRQIKVTDGRKLTGCEFSPDDQTLWVSSNMMGGLWTYRVKLSGDLEKTTIERVSRMGGPFPEAIALTSGGEIVHFSDTSGTPSLAMKTICK